MGLILAVSAAASAQKVAVLSPDGSAASRTFAEKLSSELNHRIPVLDQDLSRTAYKAVSLMSPFNLTLEESQRLGSAIGCDAFVILRAVNQRRSAFGRAEYYEAFAAIYLVSSRTGRLIWWKLASYEAPKADGADKLLDAAIAPLSREIGDGVEATLIREITETPPPAIEELPDEGSPLARGFKAPVPYRRIKPEYTPQAAFYEITATVDALIDLDATGVVTRVEIQRWAGFGLDKSVENAIREMNWRPAERNGRPLAMRFLVRYNFKKLEKDTPPS